MKRASLLFLMILFIVSLSAQKMTTISGRLLNYPDKKVHLGVKSFDPISMKNTFDPYWRSGTFIEANISSDSVFLIETDEIVQPFTVCILKFGSKKTTIILSPGDSLVVNLDYWLFETGLKYGGRGAGKTNYSAYSSLRLMNAERYKSILRLRGGNTRTERLAHFHVDQLDLLNTYLQTGEVDTIFYNWESKRIKYHYYSDLLGSRLHYRPKDSVGLTQIRGIIGDLDMDDEEAFLSIPSYPSLIRSYLNFTLDPTGSQWKSHFKSRLDLGQTKLKGNIRSYYLWTNIDNARKGAVSQIEEEHIWQYAWDHITDFRVKTLMVSRDLYHKGSSKSVPDFFQWFFQLLLIILLLAILVYSLLRYSKSLRKKNKRLNSMAWLLFGLIVGGICLMLALISSANHDTPFILYGSLCIVIFFALHTFWLIPRLIMKRRYLAYGLGVAMLGIAYYVILFNVIKKGLESRFGINPMGYDFEAWVFSLVLVILSSFLYYYVAHLARQKKGIKYLFREKFLNVEVLIHVLFLSFIFIYVIVDSRTGMVFQNYLLFLISMAIFYLNAIWLIPKYLFTKRYAKAILYSIGLLSITGLILSIMQAGFSYWNIHARGIELSFFDLLRAPQKIYLYLFVIPALIYAFAKKQILEQEKRGFNLFRKKEAELKQLRSQVNPHFLFNSLNTVYAFALKEGNDKTAESIAKLANLMRYLIDDMEQESIPIRKEIGYIDDYIKLQSIRSSVEHDIKITVELDDEQKGEMIAPMLMIPFVENAFKHGINPNNFSELIINVSMVESSLQFVIENSVNQNLETFEKEKGFGIGIQNVRKRLEYIYPNKHTLSIADTQDRFIVIMSVEL